LGVAALTLCGPGCNTPAARLNAPVHGTTAESSDMSGLYVYMQDNALLSDMTLNDMHFVPHRPMLTSLGEQRLSRIAGLVREYGGDIRYDSDLRDDGLITQRVESIRQFLCELGLDSVAQKVAPGMSGGRGMEAAEAILIRTNVNTYKPQSAVAGTAVDNAGSAPR
jgi:hypothetical protein